MIAVTLLGTGSPMPSPDRAGPATLISAGDEHSLVDAGRGGLMRLAAAGLGRPHLRESETFRALLARDTPLAQAA